MTILEEADEDERFTMNVKADPLRLVFMNSRGQWVNVPLEPTIGLLLAVNLLRFPEVVKVAKPRWRMLLRFLAWALK